MWKQFTFVNNKLAYEPKDLTDAELAKRFAQIIFMKQDGTDVELQTLELDEHFEVTRYLVTMKKPNGDVVNHKYVKYA